MGSLMASVQLTECVVSLAEDLSTSVSFKAVAVGGDHQAKVTTYEMAGGRFVDQVQAGIREPVTVNATYMDYETFEQLKAMVGHKVLFRDTRGRKMFATLGALPHQDWRPRAALESVSFSLMRSEWSEAV